MKKITALAIALLALSGIKLFAQNDQFRTCDTDVKWQELIKANPSVLERNKMLWDFTREYKGPGEKVITATGTVIYRIPIVFHVIHQYGPENISKEQILDGLDITNKSFQKLNPDTGDVIPLFQPIFADCQIEFVLANTDPNGNCTDGITRTFSTLTTSAGDNVKNLIRWPSNKYFNVWIVKNIASGAAGYAYYPGAPSTIDGVVIRHDYVGGIGTSNGSNYAERSFAHEAGHWLNLPHTWGSTNSPGDPNNCNLDDGIFDTPNTIGVANFTCNTAQNTCGQIDNVQNYMDYASCHLMFTEGQKDAMHACLNSNVGNRDNLWTSANLAATGTTAGVTPQSCAPVADFSAFEKTICEGESVSMKDVSWKGAISSRIWLFPGGNPSTDTSATPTVSYANAGNYDVSLIVTSAGGTDTLTRTGIIQVLPSTGSNSIPYAESFETITFPSGEWAIENPNNNNAWILYNSAGATGSKSLRLVNHSGNTAGSVDAFVTPSCNFTGVTGAQLSFKVAFAPKNTNDNSSLQVIVSNDCGKTWLPRGFFSGANLWTASPTSSSFVPNAGQWVTKTVSLASGIFSNKPSIRLKFYFTNDQGNNIYIDDINISTATGLSEGIAEDMGFSAWPNPGHEQMNIKMNIASKADVSIELLDMSGRLIERSSYREQNPGIFNHVLNGKGLNGMYLLRVQVDDKTFAKRVSFIQ